MTFYQEHQHEQSLLRRCHPLRFRKQRGGARFIPNNARHALMLNAHSDGIESNLHSDVNYFRVHAEAVFLQAIDYKGPNLRPL